MSNIFNLLKRRHKNKGAIGCTLTILKVYLKNRNFQTLKNFHMIYLEVLDAGFKYCDHSKNY